MDSANVVTAHKHSSMHRQEILRSELCGCFNCIEVYVPSKIVEWVDNGECAICPQCGIDSVIGSGSGYPINSGFLLKMKKHWF